MQSLRVYGKQALERELGNTAGPTTSYHEDSQDIGEQDHPPLTPGQQVIWMYKTSRHQRYRIVAELVQLGPLRARIRSRSAGGKTILRWVKPSNLRQWRSEEPSDPYPSGDD